MENAIILKSMRFVDLVYADSRRIEVQKKQVPFMQTLEKNAILNKIKH